MKILKNKIDKSVVTLGKFDCLHLGHQKLINIAKEKSLELGVPLVAYTFSNVIGKSVFTLEERLKMFEEMGCDYVYVEEFNDEFKNLSPGEFFIDRLINKLGAMHIVAGADWRFGKDRAGDISVLRDFCQEFKTGLTVVEKLMLNNDEVSSTLIKTYLEKGWMNYVSMYLGRDYYITGKVCEGKKLGRKLGFPTVNIHTEAGLVYPNDGVYATKTIIDDEEYLSVTNIGTNPTVDDKIKKAETHIIGFEGDLYGREIKVIFLDKIREEIRFPDIDSLKKQVNDDILYVKIKHNLKKDILYWRNVFCNDNSRLIVEPNGESVYSRRFIMYFDGDDPKKCTAKSEFESQNSYYITGIADGNPDTYCALMNLIKEILCPDDMEYYGFEEIWGYFKKDDIKIDVYFDGFDEIFVHLERNDYSTEEIYKADRWLTIISNAWRKKLE